MKYRCFAALLSVAFVMLTACSEDQIQARGFVLPKGDPERGLESFQVLTCTGCHVVDGVELPDVEPWLDDGRFIRLGGPVTHVQTYGDLVTSVIHPDYRVGRDKRKSKDADASTTMPNYNEVMTVQELIDIVTFLERHYDVVTYGYAIP
ncbi:MAG: cytochrome C [Pseudomonadota bacterium]